MKKPLILLVDDDPAVLLALEASIRPVFESIARVEAFDGPRAVLDNVAHWEVSGRAIAVAVVDQKMPGMTGVDLLLRLRSSPIAEHMRSILLTGYAGLDSALMAKNAARVDQYIEKPWDADALVTVLKRSLWAHASSAGTLVHIEFRELRSSSELRALLQLRTRVYLESRYTAGLLSQVHPRFDVDAYDPAARHFGLFSSAPARESQLGGGLRVVSEDAQPAVRWLLEVLAEAPDLVEKVQASRTVPLPLMAYLIDAPAVLDLYRTLRLAGEEVVEPGRFVVEPTARGARLGVHVVESAIANFFFVLQVENAMLTCHPLHSRLYRSLGFSQTAGTQRRYHTVTDGEIDCLHGTQIGVPSRARERVMALAARIRRTGATCHCATFPACLPGPYATGDFGDTDLFCPIRAGELLGVTGAGIDRERTRP